MAEHHHRVAGLNGGVARNEDAFAIPHQSANGDAGRQLEIFHRFLRDFGAFLRDEFSHVGVGIHQKAHVVHVGIEHHLIDVAGGDGFLVDDGADV